MSKSDLPHSCDWANHCEAFHAETMMTKRCQYYKKWCTVTRETWIWFQFLKQQQYTNKPGRQPFLESWKFLHFFFSKKHILNLKGLMGFTIYKIITIKTEQVFLFTALLKLQHADLNDRTSWLVACTLILILTHTDTQQQNFESHISSKEAHTLFSTPPVFFLSWHYVCVCVCVRSWPFCNVAPYSLVVSTVSVPGHPSLPPVSPPTNPPPSH